MKRNYLLNSSFSKATVIAFVITLMMFATSCSVMLPISATGNVGGTKTGSTLLSMLHKKLHAAFVHIRYEYRVLQMFTMDGELVKPQ